MRNTALLAVPLVLAATVVFAQGSSTYPATPNPPGAMGPGMRSPGMQGMDANNDGVVSRDEFMSAHLRADARFAQLDANKDGAVSREEWLAEPAGQGRSGRFDQMDSNGDGRITREELDARRTARFNALDADRDGQLTAQEMHSARDQMRKQRSQLPPGQ